MKLLLVEDEARLARTLVRGLTEEGHAVDHCALGGDAIPQGAALGYDVIVLDWMLPDVDGLSVLRAWRTAGLRTPVLMLSARGTVAEKVRGLRVGAGRRRASRSRRRRGEAPPSVVPLRCSSPTAALARAWRW